MEKKRIAIVGSGVSGLSTLWTLRNSGHEIHLFEKEERLGGHTNTVTWTKNGNSTPVDTGFIVMNTATYPNFIAFLQALQIKTLATGMTFGISRDRGAFEWSGSSPAALFAQRSNLLKPSFWRMIFDIIRFNQFALDLLSTSSSEFLNLTIGEYLERESYSEAFRDDYLIPMTACVWSTGPEKCALEFPALTLVRFMWNHHLLNTVSERPPWLTVEGGSKKYIGAVLRECKGKVDVHLGTAVESATRKDGKVELRLGGMGGQKLEVFDEVVLACHGDQARGIVDQGANPEEREILAAFETTPNKAYLHSDLSLMPRRRAAWSAWNYLTTSQSSTRSNNPASGDLQTVSLTYNMNIIQSLPTTSFDHILVTLNPEVPPLPELTQATYQYRHPLYNSRVIAAQEELEKIQGKRNIWYAGAWTGYGFHEDGFASGMKVGLRLGGDVPWDPKDAKFSRGKTPVLTSKVYVVRIVIMALQLFISIVAKVLGILRSPNQGRMSSTSTNGTSTQPGKVKGL